MKQFRKPFAIVLVLLVLLPGWLRDVHFLFFHTHKTHFISFAGYWGKEKNECPYLFLEYFLVATIDVQITTIWLPTSQLKYKNNYWFFQRITQFRMFLKRAPPL